MINASFTDELLKIATRDKAGEDITGTAIRTGASTFLPVVAGSALGGYLGSKMFGPKNLWGNVASASLFGSLASVGASGINYARERRRVAKNLGIGKIASFKNWLKKVKNFDADAYVGPISQAAEWSPYLGGQILAHKMLRGPRKNKMDTPEVRLVKQDLMGSAAGLGAAGLWFGLMAKKYKVNPFNPKTFKGV